MARDVRQRLLRDAGDGLACGRIDGGGRRQRAGREVDSCAGLKAERFTLPPQKGDEPRVLDRRPLQLIEHRLHFRHGVARRGAHLGDRVEGAGAIAFEPRLRGRAGGLDREQLLFDRVVQIARQPRPLLLPRRLADLILVLRPQPGDHRLLRMTKPRERACGSVTSGGSAGVKSAPGPGDRQIQQHEADNQGRSRPERPDIVRHPGRCTPESAASRPASRARARSPSARGAVPIGSSIARERRRRTCRAR